MTNFIDKVKCQVTIKLSNGTDIDVSYAQLGEKSNENNYITSIEILESAATNNKNPVGVVNSNILKINLNSINMNLVPDNEKSPYYGYMDNTAMIKIILEDADSEELGNVEFNDFYVSSWTSNISSDSAYEVVIEATDLLSIVNKNDTPNTDLVKNANTKEIFIDMLNKLNSNLDDKYKIKYNVSEIAFNAFPLLEYNLFDASNFGTWLNILSQSTLTNIYYTRSNRIVTDYCLDDTAKESVCNLSDKVNIVRAYVDRGGLVSYSGVKVNYILNTVNNSDELVRLNNQVLVPGINTFENISVANKVYKVNYIVIDADSYTAVTNINIEYSRSDAKLTINNNNNENVNCNIIIYGQTLKENKLFVAKYKSTNKSGETLEVTNSILPANYIMSFANNLLSLIGIKNSALTIEGYFNPRIKLGDTVYIDAESSINCKGYYKVVELKWNISSVIKCEAKVIKTITSQ